MAHRRTLAALLVGMVAACFDAPAAVVMFSCEPGDAPQCPPGYTCKQDGCCHKDGTDFATFEGQCRFAGMTESATGTSVGSSDSSDGTATGATTSGATTSGATSESSDATSSGESGTSGGASETETGTGGSSGSDGSGSTG
jgi:hypothetical protein